MSAYDMQGMVGDKGGRRVIHLTLIRRMGLDESTKKKKKKDGFEHKRWEGIIFSQLLTKRARR
jgi:hypothetical protein